ncbi:MAG: UMP kinase [Lachnospiraceae bacterium]|nr:UMP kinase [Lachnospiraceae bacterium]
MRIMLKLSGEALAGEKRTGFDEQIVRRVAAQVVRLRKDGHTVGIVIGGGNFWRGRTGNEIDRDKSDQIGMLATVMNCIYAADVFRSEGLACRIMTPFVCGAFTELFSTDRAREALDAGTVVFFAGGTGHPYFSTDTGVVLRAIEIKAEAVLLAKAIDGVYDADPAKDKNAKRYDTLTIDEVIEKNLAVVDLTASVLARDNHMELRVFALQEEESIIRAVSGSFHGTIVTAS